MLLPYRRQRATCWTTYADVPLCRCVAMLPMPATVPGWNVLSGWTPFCYHSSRYLLFIRMTLLLKVTAAGSVLQPCTAGVPITGCRLYLCSLLYVLLYRLATSVILPCWTYPYMHAYALHGLPALCRIAIVYMCATLPELPCLVLLFLVLLLLFFFFPGFMHTMLCRFYACSCHQIPVSSCL
jgi:hypothetical protein